MKYEVLAKGVAQWVFTVDAESPEEAERKLEKAIEDGEEGDLPVRILYGYGLS